MRKFLFLWVVVGLLPFAAADDDFTVVGYLSSNDFQPDCQTTLTLSPEQIQRIDEIMAENVEPSAVPGKVVAVHLSFDILDKAGVEDEEITAQELTIDQLREDEHIEYPDKLIEKINNYKGTFVRAPKMM